MPPKLFVQNSILGYFELNDGHIEELPEKIFKNSPDLHEVHMMNGMLISIDVDFTKFKKITAINFVNNTCVNDSSDGSDLREFQKMLNENC